MTDQIVLVTPGGKYFRWRVFDTGSGFQDLPAIGLCAEIADNPEFTNARKFAFEATKEMDSGAWDGALPNSPDVLYGDDSTFTLLTAFYRRISHNTLRNDAPKGNPVLDAQGRLIGVSLDAYPNQTLTGYAPNGPASWSIGAGKMGEKGYKKGQAWANSYGNITSASFAHPNGQYLSSVNPLDGPWTEGHQIRLQGPPVPAWQPVYLDFGMGDEDIWQPTRTPASGSAFLSKTWATDTMAGQSGACLIGRITYTYAPYTTFEWYTADPNGTSRAGAGLINVVNFGRGVYGPEGIDPGANHLAYGYGHIGDYQTSPDPSRKLVIGGQPHAYVAWSTNNHDYSVLGEEYNNARLALWSRGSYRMIYT